MSVAMWTLLIFHVLAFADLLGGSYMGVGYVILNVVCW
jgi:hypothetical protein